MFWALSPGYEHLYDSRFGLVQDKALPAADPMALIG
jgi:hypothetical protein